MSIIYLKNPRSGSHFRIIGALGHPPRKGARAGAGVVAWSSCAFRASKGPTFPQYREGLNPGQSLWFRDLRPSVAAGTLFALLGIRDPKYHGAPVQFSRPCRQLGPVPQTISPTK